MKLSSPFDVISLLNPKYMLLTFRQYVYFDTLIMGKSVKSNRAFYCNVNFSASLPPD